MPPIFVKATFIPYNGAAANPITVQYAMGNPTADDDRYLIFFHGGDIATATYDGIALASAATDTSPFCRIWVAEDAFLPTDTSDHPLVLTFGGTRTNQGVLVVEYRQAKQLGVVPVAACNSAASTASQSVDLNTTVDNVTILAFCLRVEDRTMDSEPSGTPRWSIDIGPVFNAQRIIEVTGGAAGLHTLTFDSSGNSNNRVGAIQLEEAAAASGVEAAGDLTMPSLTLGGAADVQVQADGGLSLPMLTLAGTGAVRVGASGMLSLPMLSLAGAGEIGVTASAQLLMPSLVLAGQADVEIQAAASLMMPMLALSGLAHGPAVEASGGLTMPMLTLGAAAAVTTAGRRFITGRVTMRPVVTGSVCTRPVVTGRVKMRPVVTARVKSPPGPGVPPGPRVTGSLVLPMLTLSGDASTESVPLEIVAAPTLPMLTLSGTAGAPVEAAGGLTLPMLTLAGAAEVTTPVTPLLHTFTGADNPSSVGTADSGHVPIVFSGTWGRIGGLGYMSSGPAHAVLGFDCGTGNGRIQATIAVNADNLGRINGRISDNSNYIQLTNNAIGDLRKRVAGVVSLLGSGFGKANAGQTYGLDFSGTAISVVRDGVVLTTVTDAFNQAATIHGLGNAATTSTGNRWDDLTFTPA